MYKTVTWNTGSAATRFLVKRKQKSEPPANKKLINKLHDKWLKDNGYKLQAPSSPAGQPKVEKNEKKA